MSDLRLVIFDVDGTLIDSQNDILSCMRAAFTGFGLPAPSRADVLGIVGLSLPQVMQRLAPEQSESLQAELVEAYKSAYSEMRQRKGAAGSPLYPGAKETLAAFNADAHTLLAVATGKSRRGVDAAIALHGLDGLFVSLQTADTHPSKPHPSMIQACLADAGVAPDRAVMVGDTSYDMDMARAAGVIGIGVDWGYHSAEQLNADHMIDDFAQLGALIDHILELAQ